MKRPLARPRWMVLAGAVVATISCGVPAAGEGPAPPGHRAISVVVRELVSKRPIEFVEVKIRDAGHEVRGEKKILQQGITGGNGVFATTVPAVPRLIVEWRRSGFAKDPETTETTLDRASHLELDLIDQYGDSAYFRDVAQAFKEKATQAGGSWEAAAAVYNSEWARLGDLPPDKKRIVANELIAQGVTRDLITEPFFVAQSSDVRGAEKELDTKGGAKSGRRVAAKRKVAKVASGTVKSASADGLVIGGKMKGKEEEWTFGVDSKTTIKKGGKAITAADIKAGDSVQVKYTEDAGKMTASSVTVKSAPAKEAEKMEKIDNKMESRPAEKK